MTFPNRRLRKWMQRNVVPFVYLIRGYLIGVMMAVYLLYKSLLNQAAIPRRDVWVECDEENGTVLWKVLVFILTKESDDTPRSRA